VGAALLLVDGSMVVEVEASGEKTAAGLGVDPAVPALLGREMLVGGQHILIDHGRILVQDLQSGKSL